MGSDTQIPVSRVSAAKKKLKSKLARIGWQMLNKVQELYNKTEKIVKGIHSEFARKEEDTTIGNTISEQTLKLCEKRNKMAENKKKKTLEEKIEMIEMRKIVKKVARKDIHKFYEDETYRFSRKITSQLQKS